jgi:hypothetical protein
MIDETFFRMYGSLLKKVFNFPLFYSSDGHWGRYGDPLPVSHAGGGEAGLRRGGQPSRRGPQAGGSFPSARVADPDPHHFDNLDLHPDPHRIKIWIRICINVQMTSQNVLNMSLFKCLFKGQGRR